MNENNNVTKPEITLNDIKKLVVNSNSKNSSKKPEITLYAINELGVNSNSKDFSESNSDDIKILEELTKNNSLDDKQNFNDNKSENDLIEGYNATEKPCGKVIPLNISRQFYSNMAYLNNRAENLCNQRNSDSAFNNRYSLLQQQPKYDINVNNFLTGKSNTLSSDSENESETNSGSFNN